MKPVLYILSTPIGNPKDISLHTLEILQKSDLIIGEEYKETSKLLKRHNITKGFELLNEHSTREDILKLIKQIKRSTVSSILSDSGSACIEDPAGSITQLALAEGIELKVAPGASSLVAALSLCGFYTSPFTFIGFFSREDATRKQEILHYLNYKHTLVFFETPYRYKKVILEIASMVKKEIPIFLGLDLTTDSEYKYYGNIKHLCKILDTLPKAPPVIVLGLTQNLSRLYIPS
jgi:16S rRNA (cytidine1402-2'-O)-methyltransferase